jgi:hypothetical protein
MIRILCGCLLAFCLGCDRGPEIASVEGTVTMDGKPLSNATVVFIPENGRPAGGRTDERGHYSLIFTRGRSGALLGKNSIRITTAAEATEAADGTPIPAQRETIPAKYNSQSTLEFTVEGGKENIANFDLDSKGALPAADTY